MSPRPPSRATRPARRRATGRPAAIASGRRTDRTGGGARVLLVALPLALLVASTATGRALAAAGATEVQATPATHARTPGAHPVSTAPPSSAPVREPTASPGDDRDPAARRRAGAEGGEIERSGDVAEAPADRTTPGVDPVALVSRVLELVEELYVFPDRVPAVVEGLGRSLASGEYTGVGSDELAERLTRDLRCATSDLHFVALVASDAPAGADDPEAQREQWRRDGFGFRAVEVLDGNVGYARLSAFVPPAVAAESADAALRLVAGTDALIFDLRQSRGGSGRMVAHLLGHLFDGEPFLFNRFHWRPTNATAELYTAEATAPRYTGGRPVFVLTSGTTPSAAEGFAYHLKHFQRATVVGAPTAGAAHPVRIEPLGEELVLYVPAGRPESPVTGTNWEGTGVIPHVEVPPEDALSTAHRLALEAILERGVDDEDWAEELRRIAEDLEEEAVPSRSEQP